MEPASTKMTIHDKILRHKYVYEMMDYEIPVYKMTCAEHKQFYNEMKHLLPEDHKVSLLANYYGIDIEVVMRIEEYV